MDQLLIDISDITNIKIGDEVILIGENEKISASMIAMKGGTITNELLSRLSNRLPRIVSKEE